MESEHSQGSLVRTIRDSFGGTGSESNGSVQNHLWPLGVAVASRSLWNQKGWLEFCSVQKMSKFDLWNNNQIFILIVANSGWAAHPNLSCLFKKPAQKIKVFFVKAESLEKQREKCWFNLWICVFVTYVMMCLTGQMPMGYPRWSVWDLRHLREVKGESRWLSVGGEQSWQRTDWVGKLRVRWQLTTWSTFWKKYIMHFKLVWRHLDCDQRKEDHKKKCCGIVRSCNTTTSHTQHSLSSEFHLLFNLHRSDLGRTASTCFIVL